MGTVRVSKKALYRLNIVRIYHFSILIGAIFLLATVAFNIFNYFFADEAFQNSLIIGFVLFLFTAAAAAFVLVRTKKSKYYRAFVYGYWLLFCLLFHLMASLCLSPAAAIVCYWIMMMGIGIIPALPPKRYMIIWTVQLALLAWLIFNQQFSSEGIISIITINLMSIVMSMSTYNACIKSLSMKERISTAITQAETDPMTQLLNRRGLLKRVSAIWPHCVRQRISVSILMMDIDNFKKYNDAFGHAQGDECIRMVTKAIRDCTKRKTDYCARVGGEEFLVLLTDTDAVQALRWSTSLKKRIEALQIPHSDKNFLPFVTISIGIASCQPSKDTSFEDLRNSADDELYNAKEKGRACISVNNKIYSRINSDLRRKRAHG